jgi:hypothetical protein
VDGIPVAATEPADDDGLAPGRQRSLHELILRVRTQCRAGYRRSGVGGSPSQAARCRSMLSFRVA